MSWPAYVLIGWFVLNALLSVALIGRTRKPISPGEACVNLVIYPLLIWAVVALEHA